MPSRRWIEGAAVAVAIGFACACDNSTTMKSSPVSMQSPPGVQPGAPGTAPPANAPIAPAGTAGAASPPLMMTPAMMMPPTTPPEMMAPNQDPPTTAEPEPDPCTDFVVSRRKPCSNDPNPCKIDSGYPGDEYCLPPPAPDEGVQVHFGPKDYTNKAEVEKYLLEPMQELNDYGVANVPISEDRSYNRVVYQMRPGSHHLINSLISGHGTEGFVPGGAGCDGTRVGSLGGTQNLIYDSRPNGIVPPENEGLGYTLPGNSSICFNYHRYNTTDAPTLSEIWVNFYFVDEADVTQHAMWGVIIGGLGMSIPPGAERELTYSYTFSGLTANADNPPRIIQLFGHRHASTYHFAAWLNDEQIYDSWDWQESVTFNYDSLTKNPPVDPAKKLDGGHSGVLPVKNGDVLKYTCYIRNETDGTLNFANELYTAEMCNLFGQGVGASWNGLNF